MLNIVRSNRVELLLLRLARRLLETPLASPFAAERVVVPSPAMARWVKLRLAQYHGVAANLEHPLPASFVWQLARGLLADLPEQDPLDLDHLTWKIFGQLPQLVGQPAFSPLRAYLGEDRAGLKRFQLAHRIADVFDRYQLYRPQLIRQWEAGAGEAAEADWQAILWRRLTGDIRGRHRVAVIDQLIRALDQPGPSLELPERVSLFAISSLPPLLVDVIHALAKQREVDLYLCVPTDAFWADLVSQKTLARKRLEQPEEADLWEVGNSLLASWGRQGQALQDLLLDRETPITEDEVCAEPPTETLLGRLQRDIFTLRPIADDAEREAVEADISIQVHVCHSALRECQVLHDELLRCLEADAELRPEDILIMVPEISAYAPYIEAVFRQGEDSDRPFIPWNLSDISVRDEHPLVQVFPRLLALPESRFSHSEVLSYLDVPELAAHFGLDTDAVAQVRDWLARVNLRWGLDGAHKRRLGLPPTEENTWAQAEQRLFGGYALGANDRETGLFAGIAPIGGVEGKNAEVLGRFWRLFARLGEAAEQLAVPRDAAGWQSCIGGLLTDFFGERDDDDGRLQKIRDAVADLAAQAGALTELLPPDLIRHWLALRLDSDSRSGRYFSGGVTFCGMRPMRSLPFKIIGVLGLQDHAFPRRDRMAEFDRMRKHWRPGDPRKGDEDRYLFLETLLCARQCLYLSYVGQDIRKNSERQPSVLVRELLDYIDQQYRSSGGGTDRPSKRLTIRHPLHPFSPRNFAAAQLPDTERSDNQGSDALCPGNPCPESQGSNKRGSDKQGPDNQDPVKQSPDKQSPDKQSPDKQGPDNPDFVNHGSYDPYWCQVANAMRRAPTPATDAPRGWSQARLPEAPSTLRELTLAQLERFVRHPVKYFINSRLRVYLEEAALEDDDEPFTLDGLQAFGLRQRLVADRLQGNAPSREGLSAEGALPHGAFAELVLARQSERAAPLVATLSPYQGVQPRQLLIDLVLGGDAGPFRVSGQLGGIYPDLGLLRWKPSALKGGDILSLWLAHLCWCASGDPEEKRSVLYSTDGHFSLPRSLPPDAARAALEQLLAWHWEGLHHPLLVLPKASYAYARALQKGGKADPMNAARSEWHGNSYHDIPGDKDDLYVRLVLRAVTGEPLAHARFAELAEAFFSQALRSGELA